MSLNHAARSKRPLDLLENILEQREWTSERIGDEELTLSVRGTRCDYHVSVNWRADLAAIHLASAFDLSVPGPRLTETHRLVAMVNEQLWLGHFDVWAADGLILYRNAIMLNDAVVSRAQLERLVDTALEACERNYQAFHFVVWAGKDAASALRGTMFETKGCA
ncbi:MAG: YbjN domain-containing protein [Pseudomonadota bacterium]